MDHCPVHPSFNEFCPSCIEARRDANKKAAPAPTPSPTAAPKDDK